jgi:hypothetical protein
MLLALAKKLRADLTKTSDTGPNPIGTLSHDEPYPQLRYGEIDGIGTVTIDRTGNMTGFSPVERCKDRFGEIAWVPTELVRNLRLEPFPVPGELTTR